MSRKYRVGLVGWRGMVGSVLMDRMRAEKDFDLFDPVFFSTSNAGGKAPMGDAPLGDAHDIKALSALDAIVTCQGGDYTLETLPEARIVESYGGGVAFIPLVEGKSTTNIIARAAQK